MNEIQATVVFEKTWDAIHAINDDGSRKYRYIIEEGSSRSSKTQSLVQINYLYGHQNKNKRMSVWRDTKKDCRDTVGSDVKQIFPTLPFANYVSFNKTEAIYSFPSGSVFEINGTDEPNKLHGYNCNVAWFNEPYDISRDTFDQLDMRTTDFILIDWNPQKSHWIDDLKKDPRTIVIHSTFKDNPFCPVEQKIKILSYQPVKLCAAVTEKILSELEARDYNLTENVKNLSDKQLKELARCKENERKMSASAYKWSVYGLGLKAEKPNRIFFWEEISDDRYNAIDAKRYYGVDWGTVDPWGILEAKYYDGALYLHEKNYNSENQWREGIPLPELEAINKDPEGGLVKWLFNKLNIDKKSDIICDTNRPLKIQALWEAGYDFATAAPKPPGSIVDGIDLLCGMKVYYTSSSTNLKYEQENYERQVDRYGIVLEEPCDKWNHCFSGDTLVCTVKGKVRIDKINLGDLVLTSNGYKPVIGVWDNGEKQTFKYRMQFDTFSVNLVCTPNHRVWTKEKNWVPISKLEPGMTVSLIRDLTAEPTHYSQEKGISEMERTVCIGMFGSIRTNKKDQSYSMCITSMKTRGTIDLITLRSGHQTNIDHITLKKDLLKIESGQHYSIREASNQQNIGIDQKKATNGTNSKVLIRGLAENTKQKLASIAASHIKLDTQENQNSAITTAKLLRLEKGEESKMKVYDLTVLDHHEYFANNVLVHNCMDPARYIALYLTIMGIIKRS